MLLVEEEIKTDKIEHINAHTVDLTRKFADVMIADAHLSRQVVSFQANKQRPVYRWYKYKEGFSADLVEYLFGKYKIKPGNILDPFAGAGTALFVAREAGHDAYGIEVLPIGQEIIKTRKILENGIKRSFLSCIEEWVSKKPWMKETGKKEFVTLRITRGAYPKETEEKIRKYLGVIEKEDTETRQVLLFALLCILEAVSYTRKDGQYLRWDHRSGRTNGEKVFDKGAIRDFDSAILSKLKEIEIDLKGEGIPIDLYKSHKPRRGDIFIYESSCLEQLPKLGKEKFSCIITSPPYCNRYDYTRTYALELAMLGVDEELLRMLRQRMLSCTVENKEKDLLSIHPEWEVPLSIAQRQVLLRGIIAYLEDMKNEGRLNNAGIVRMVRGYFYEMSCVIYECRRILKKGGYFFMINDNVKYAGVGIPVDLILSDLASSMGFEIRNILVLPQGKGNSSQQMGQHGREVLRKCVYVWQRN